MAYVEQRRFDRDMQKLAGHTVEITRNDSTIPTVVFILGESTTRNHMGIYGYAVPTTPHLQQRKNRGELHVFTDVISPHTYTMAVMPHIFSFYDMDSPGEFSDYGDLFDILRQAGYYTTWISNQESSGSNGGDIGLLYAKRCDTDVFTDVKNPLSKTRYDELILPLLQESLSVEQKKNFTVVHLLGTHAFYTDRYPPAYEHFTVADETGLDESKKAVRASYDNAILYNDYIVDEIIRQVEDKNAVVIYTSDHGDDVYDEAQDGYGHWVDGNFRMLEIPLVIWTSSKFKAAYPELDAAMERSVNRPFMTDYTIHFILDMLQIETPEYDSVKSLLSVQYNEKRQRVYAGNVYSNRQ